MAYDPHVAERIRVQLESINPYTEKRMFGGIAFFVNGNMACGIMDDRVMVRVGPERYAAALDQPHAAPFERNGKPMKGWVSVQPDGYASDDRLARWLRRGVEFAAPLPPK